MTRAGPKASRFARRLLAEWKRLDLPQSAERVVVAVSGGADSTALMLALNELIVTHKLSASIVIAHLNHGLRGEAGEEDACWVTELAADLGFECVLGQTDVKAQAEEYRDNLEQAARRTRYGFLLETAKNSEARIVLTAHTLDDQAETVLLRLVRGSGAEGLSGIEAVRALDEQSNVLLARPLLNWASRAETENYCREREVAFKSDAMNEDERFARVRVRRRLIPLLKTFNPRIVEALDRTARLLREDAEALNEAAQKLLTEASEGDPSAGASLRVDVLARARASLGRRALRRWIALARGDLLRLELVHLLAVEGLLKGERGGRVVLLPGGDKVSRRRGRLYYHKKVEKGVEAV
jgi:tRNA(Ile)-lysidine synthase